MLLASVEQALSNSQSSGMHALVPTNHKSTIDLYVNLGFQEYDITSEITSKGFVLLFKSLTDPSNHPTEPSGVKILGRCETAPPKQPPTLSPTKIAVTPTNPPTVKTE